MPLYVDIHTIRGVTPEAVAKAHTADVAVQGSYGVEYLKYWVNQDNGKVFCLCHAPTAEAARAVHRDAHGLVAEKIVEVDPDILDAFMGEARVNSVGAALLGDGSQQCDNGIRSVMFTDIVGSTEMTHAIGDLAAMDILRIHDGIVRGALAALGGREVKHTGDGIMSCFFSAIAAMQCAARIQQELATRNTGGEAHPIKVRIGVAAGEPVEQGQDLFGSTVQLAARLCARAQSGQILVSSAIVELCVGKDVTFADLGEAQLKGFPQPVNVHAVEWAARV